MTTFFLSFIALVSSINLPRDHAPFVDPRDGNRYEVVELDGLLWFTENLRLKTDNSIEIKDNVMACGEFYLVDEALSACPEGWRLPTELEVKKLVKQNKRGKINLTDSLDICLCGRIDDGEHARMGEQNTFWLDAELEDGHIMHWHTFADKQELHNHNVVVVSRQFPVRCVCEASPQSAK